MLRSLALLLGCATLVCGQAVRIDPAPQNPYPAGAGIISSRAGALAVLCNNTSIPCNSLAVTYTDVTATTQCPATAQVTLPGGNTCINHADFQTGAFGFWVNPAATYYYSYTPPNGQTLGPYPVTAPGISGGVGYPSSGLTASTGLAWRAPNTADITTLLGTGSTAQTNLALGTLALGNYPAAGLTASTGSAFRAAILSDLTGLGAQSASSANSNNAGIGNCSSGLFGTGTAAGSTQPCAQVQAAQVNGLGTLATAAYPSSGLTASNGTAWRPPTLSDLTGLGAQSAASPNGNNAGLGNCSIGQYQTGNVTGTPPCSQVQAPQVAYVNPATGGLTTNLGQKNALEQVSLADFCGSSGAHPLSSSGCFANAVAEAVANGGSILHVPATAVPYPVDATLPITSPLQIVCDSGATFQKTADQGIFSFAANNITISGCGLNGQFSVSGYTTNGINTAASGSFTDWNFNNLSISDMGGESLAIGGGASISGFHISGGTFTGSAHDNGGGIVGFYAGASNGLMNNGWKIIQLHNTTGNTDAIQAYASVASGTAPLQNISIKDGSITYEGGKVPIEVGNFCGNPCTFLGGPILVENVHIQSPAGNYGAGISFGNGMSGEISKNTIDCTNYTTGPASGIEIAESGNVIVDNNYLFGGPCSIVNNQTSNEKVIHNRLIGAGSIYISVDNYATNLSNVVVLDNTVVMPNVGIGITVQNDQPGVNISHLQIKGNWIQNTSGGCNSPSIYCDGIELRNNEPGTTIDHTDIEGNHIFGFRYPISSGEAAGAYPTPNTFVCGNFYDSTNYSPQVADFTSFVTNCDVGTASTTSPPTWASQGALNFLGNGAFGGTGTFGGNITSTNAGGPLLSLVATGTTSYPGFFWTTPSQTVGWQLGGSTSLYPGLMFLFDTTANKPLSLVAPYANGTCGGCLGWGGNTSSIGSSAFLVNSAGNIIKLNGATTTFPSSNSVGVLTNNGSGTLTWGPGSMVYPGAGVPLSTGTSWGASYAAPTGALVGTGQPNTYTAGFQNFSSVPFAPEVGSSNPATCTVGQMFFNTSYTAGQNWAYCTATNTWTQQLNGGGSGVATFSGDGALLTNSGSTGGVTAALGTAAAYSFWGNNSAATATPGYHTIPAAAIPTLNQSTTGNAGTATALAATPTLCSTGSAPIGILANGNATGCAVIPTAGVSTPAFTGAPLVASSSNTLVQANATRLYANQYSGADPSIQINACIAAVIAAGGGVCDASMLNGTYTMSQQINLGTAGSVTNVVLLLPETGRWNWNLASSGTGCGIYQSSGTSLLGEQPGGAGALFYLNTSSGSTSMDSLYCTDSTISGGGYFRAEGFGMRNDGGGFFTSGLAHVQNSVDQSSWRNIYVWNNSGDAWHIDSACCGDSFDGIQGYASLGFPPGTGGYTQGGNALVLGKTGSSIISVNISNSTFNAPKTSDYNILIQGNVSSATFLNDYMEGNGLADTSTPMVYIGSTVSGVQFIGGSAYNFCPTTCAGKYSFENHSPGGFSVKGMDGYTGGWINDVANSKTVVSVGTKITNSLYAAGPGTPIIQGSSMTLAGHTVALGGTQTIACTDLTGSGTACSANTGTSGATVPLLNANNTYSGNNTHSGSETFTGSLGAPDSASLPGTCTVGQVYFLTGVTAGSNWYGCTATNTWTQLGGSGGGTINWARSYQTASQTIPASASTDLTFDTNDPNNTAGIHSTTVNPAEFIAPSTGPFAGSCSSTTTSTAGGALYITVLWHHSGTDIEVGTGSEVNPGGSGGPLVVAPWSAYMTAGDYVHCQVYSVSGITTPGSGNLTQMTFMSTGLAGGGGGGSGITQLTGDVTAGPGSGSQAATVVQVNGAAIPASQSCLGSDSGSHLIAGTCSPSGFNATVAGQVLSIAAGSMSTNVTTNYAASACTLSGSTSGVAYVYVDSTGALTVGSLATFGSCTGPMTYASGITAFPANARALWTVATTSGAFSGSPQDLRANYFHTVINGNLVTINSDGSYTINNVGTVNSGTASHLAYYAASGTAVSDMGSDFLFTTHTLTGGASAILDLSATSPTAGLKLPSAAGAVPTADGFIAINTTTHALTWGSNGTTIVGASAGTGTAAGTTCTNQWVSALSATAAPTCSTVTYLGTVTNGTWQATVIGSAYGGTGVNNTATLTLGTSNQNWATLGTGLVKNTTTTGALSNAAGSDIVSLVQGLTGCNTATYVFTPQASDCVAPSGGGSGTVNSGTANQMTYYAASGTAVSGDSLFTDNGTTLSYTGTGGFTASAGVSSGGSAITWGTGGGYGMNEGTAATALTGSDIFYADSTKHQILSSLNGGSFLPLVQGPTSTTSGHFALWNATNGGLLQDGGAFTLTGLGATFSSPLSLSGNTVTCPTCVTTSGGGALSGVAPIAVTSAGVVSFQNSAAANVTSSLGTDTKIFTASGAAAGNGNVITGDPQGGIADSGTNLSALAPLNSPDLTGTPTSPTPAAGNASTDIATTLFVSNAVAASNPATAVLAATTGSNLTGTYSNGASGIGATFTITATGAFTLDGVSIGTIGQRVLLKDQTSTFQNGVYTATTVGTTGVSPVFTRATDYNQASDINSTGAIFVQSGTANATTSWLLTSTVATIGTDAITYTQATYAPGNLVTAAANFTSGNLVQAAASNKTTSDSGIATANVVTQTSNASSGQVCTYTGTNKVCVPGQAAISTAVSGLGTGVATALAVGTGSAGAFGVLIASGTAAMNTSLVASGACETVVTVSATGVATTDVITAGFSGDPTAVTGYGASATGAILTIYPYPTSGNVNFKVCNNTGSSITPGALTLNWRVGR